MLFPLVLECADDIFFFRNARESTPFLYIEGEHTVTKSKTTQKGQRPKQRRLLLTKTPQISTARLPLVELDRRLRRTAAGLRSWGERAVGNVKMQLIMAHEVILRLDAAQE